MTPQSDTLEPASVMWQNVNQCMKSAYAFDPYLYPYFHKKQTFLQLQFAGCLFNGTGRTTAEITTLPTGIWICSCFSFVCLCLCLCLWGSTVDIRNYLHWHCPNNCHNNVASFYRSYLLLRPLQLLSFFTSLKAKGLFGVVVTRWVTLSSRRLSLSLIICMLLCNLKPAAAYLKTL